MGHALVGKRIAEKWNLPPALTSMIMLHHQPAFSKEHFEITAVVQAADMVARKLGLGSGGDTQVPAGRLGEAPAQGLSAPLARHRLALGRHNTGPPPPHDRADAAFLVVGGDDQGDRRQAGRARAVAAGQHPQRLGVGPGVG